MFILSINGEEILKTKVGEVNFTMTRGANETYNFSIEKKTSVTESFLLPAKEIDSINANPLEDNLAEITIFGDTMKIGISSLSESKVAYGNNTEDSLLNRIIIVGVMGV